MFHKGKYGNFYDPLLPIPELLGYALWVVQQFSKEENRKISNAHIFGFLRKKIGPSVDNFFVITFAYNKSFRNSKVHSLWSILILAGGTDLVILGLLANQTLAENQHPKIIESCGITEFWKRLFLYNETICLRSQTLVDRIYVYPKSRKIGKTRLKKKRKMLIPSNNFSSKIWGEKQKMISIEVFNYL